MLTPNEKKVLRYLVAYNDKDSSINELAKECSLSPNGAYKILKKLEKEGVLQQKAVANIRSFKIMCPSLKAKRLIEWAFMDAIEGRLKYRLADLSPLQNIVDVCLAFGSYTTAKKTPADLDLLVILKKNKYQEYKRVLEKVQGIVPIPIHDVVQTWQDLDNPKNAIMRQALRGGVVLWGQDKLVEVLCG